MINPADPHSAAAQNVRVSAVPPTGGASADPATAFPRVHAIATGRKAGAALHAALRGRYHWAVIWGLVLSGLLGGLGWKVAHPLYKSEGLLRMAYVLPAVQTETDVSSAKPMFLQYMITQRLMITSRRVIDLAIQDSIWKSMGVPVPSEPERYFAEHLQVEIRPNSEFIQIIVTDQSPNMVGAAVQAVVSAYKTIYEQDEKRFELNRTSILKDEKQELDDKVKALKSEINEIAQ